MKEKGRKKAGMGAHSNKGALPLVIPLTTEVIIIF